jgi:hypothetical protein
MSENNITKLITALVGPGQSVEDALQQLYSERRVDTAIGEQLDVLGRLVGQPRNGMVDDDYRRMIRARISVNRSKGTIADAITVSDLVIDDDAITYEVDNQGVAAYVVRLMGAPVTDTVAALLIAMLRDTAAGGVRPILEYSDQAYANWLFLDEDNLDEESFFAAID